MSPKSDQLLCLIQLSVFERQKQVLLTHPRVFSVLLSAYTASLDLGKLAKPGSKQSFLLLWSQKE